MTAEPDDLAPADAFAILAGTYNERPSFEAVAVDGYYPACSPSATGGSSAATYKTLETANPAPDV